MLKRVKHQTGLDSLTYKSMYPTGCVPPKFYGLPKIHKPDTPLRPIMSSCGSVTYGVAKELAKILKPLVGKYPHHINSTQDFVEQAKHITLMPGECLSSHDVSALFTLVPVDPALNIIKDLLDKDHTPKESTVLAVNDITLLLEFCIKNTHFSFQDQFCEQVEGAAMGFPVGHIVANLYMEYLEQKALSTAPHSPRFWWKFVDDTFVIHKEVNKQDFLQHINSVDAAIRFTVEDNKEDGSIPFLDTTVKPEADCSLSITVYRKPKQVSMLSPMKTKLRATLSYPTHKVFVKASRSVVDMAFKPTSKVAVPSRTSWSPPRIKTLWSTKVVPYIGTYVVT